MTHTCIHKDLNTTDAICSAMTAKDIMPFTLCTSHTHKSPMLEMYMHGRDCALCLEHVIQPTANMYTTPQLRAAALGGSRYDH